MNLAAEGLQRTSQATDPEQDQIGSMQAALPNATNSAALGALSPDTPTLSTQHEQLKAHLSTQVQDLSLRDVLQVREALTTGERNDDRALLRDCHSKAHPKGACKAGCAAQEPTFNQVRSWSHRVAQLKLPQAALRFKRNQACAEEQQQVMLHFDFTRMEATGQPPLLPLRVRIVLRGVGRTQLGIRACRSSTPSSKDVVTKLDPLVEMHIEVRVCCDFFEHVPVSDQRTAYMLLQIPNCLQLIP